MYELSIQRIFSAAHAIMIQGHSEPLHGHDWQVTAVITGAILDEDGLLIDFHDLEDSLERIIAPFQNANLNDVPPFKDSTNPTAECVAEHIGRSLAAAINSERVHVSQVRVTEAPGCVASFYLNSNEA